MVVFPHVKINIGLRVIRKREDGFHELETIFYPVTWTDILEIGPETDSPRLHLSGLALDGDAADNLCMKAYQLLSEDFRLPPLEIFLHKIVPAGAGLGGGSSDAAFTLRLINRFCELGLPDARLENYAERLGSDCAFFIKGLPCLATGRGEIMQPVKLSLKDYHILLVVPPVHVSTREAYAGVKPMKPAESLEKLISTPVENWKDKVINDFEQTVFAGHPEIARIKTELYKAGALYASMSGSGSALYGLFKDDIDRKQHWDNCQVCLDPKGMHP
ncbi:MAG: 4-(cytidine 5'-diphospho)-2-C-methyl-D-erythritol kinase [Bacteroidales bacterium]